MGKETRGKDSREGRLIRQLLLEANEVYPDGFLAGIYDEATGAVDGDCGDSVAILIVEEVIEMVRQRADRLTAAGASDAGRGEVGLVRLAVIRSLAQSAGELLDVVHRLSASAED